MEQQLGSALRAPARLSALRATELLDTPAEDAFDRLTRLAARVLRAPVALISLVDAERQFLKSVVGLREPWASAREIPLGHGLAHLVVETGEPLVVQDAREDAALRGSAAVQEMGLVAFAAHPLRTRDGHVIGTFCAADEGARVWTGEELEALATLAAAAAAQIDLRRELAAHERAEQRVRRSEARFRAMAENISDILSIFDADGCVLYHSPSYTRVLGYPVEERIGRSALETMHPDDHAAFRAALRTVRERTGPVELRFRVRRADGAWRYCEATAVDLLDNPAVRGVVTVTRDVSARVDAEHALAESEQRYKSLFWHNPHPVYGFDLTGRFVAANPAVERLVGVPVETLLGEPFLPLVDPEDRERAQAIFARAAGGEPQEYEVALRTHDGDRREIRGVSVPVVVDGVVVGVYGTAEDVTERRRLEAQLRQAGKMEAVGRLAGGVAHDFNNMLTAIKGYAQFLLEGLNEGDALREDAAEIARSADRASALTRQLLAFSRKQMLQPQVLDLNEVVSGMAPMLARLIGEDIRLETRLAADLERVEADPGQLEQVLMNLAVNARDAMPRGGRLRIETRNVELDAGYARRHPEIRAGTYVMLAVTDTGVGIPKELREHVFEPFFTTKQHGGTGLGLAMVYGIIKQSGGYIYAYSEEGQGSSFKIYLPRTAASPAAASRPRERAPAGRGELVLLVEDEHAVRELAHRILERAGYRVIDVANAAEALLVAEHRQGQIDLLLTDVVMPGLNGRELAQRLLALRPGLRVLYMSGYTEDEVIRRGVVEFGESFLEKPFSPDQLAEKVRAVLDGVAEE